MLETMNSLGEKYGALKKEKQEISLKLSRMLAEPRVSVDEFMQEMQKLSKVENEMKEIDAKIKLMM